MLEFAFAVVFDKRLDLSIDLELVHRLVSVVLGGLVVVEDAVVVPPLMKLKESSCCT